MEPFVVAVAEAEGIMLVAQAAGGRNSPTLGQTNLNFPVDNRKWRSTESTK